MIDVRLPIAVYIIGRDNQEINKLLTDRKVFNQPIISQQSWLTILKDNPNQYLLIINDYSISSLSAGIMSELAQQLVTKSLADKCQLQHHVLDLTNNFSLYTSQQPRGLQAILVTPTGSNKIVAIMNNGVTDDLSHQIHQGQLIAEVVRPSPMTFDLTRAADNTNYLKLNQCQVLKIGTRELPSPEIPIKTSWWSYLIIVIILLLLLFIIYRCYK